jgi:hypothetical protein
MVRQEQVKKAHQTQKPIPKRCGSPLYDDHVSTLESHIDRMISVDCETG